jgi:hypothetical protein
MKLYDRAEGILSYWEIWKDHVEKDSEGAKYKRKTEEMLENEF